MPSRFAEIFAVSFPVVHAPAIGHPLITGEATASARPFSQAMLSNSHIYRFGGYVPGSPDVGVGLLHFDGAAAVSGTAYERSGGTANSTTLSAQYAVDPTTGRFTFSGTGVPVVGYAVPSASGITGYLVGTGASAASGTMEFQTDTYPPGYQFGPINGHYGLGIHLERRRLGHVWRQHVHGDQSVEVFLHRCFAAERTSSGHRGAETAVGFVIECADTRPRSN